MDETVNSFLKEINQIAPPKSVWEECYDEKSGFTYYWNIQTDDVTWDVPPDYKKISGKGDNTKKKLYIPPPSEDKLMLGSIPHVNMDKIKIYKIDDVQKVMPTVTTKKEHHNSKNVARKKLYPKRLSDSEDEKIVLISSYGSDSTSEDEDNVSKATNENKIKVQDSNCHSPEKVASPKVNTFPEKKLSSPYNSEDETDILTQIQTKAKMLKQMGGELPDGVKRLVSDTNEKKDVTGFSLVAGYGNSDDESEQEEEQSPQKTLFPIHNTKPIASLFPIVQPTETASPCEEEPLEKSTTPPPEENVDLKAFQRKRRIGVSLINTQKRPPQPPEHDNKVVESERPGFGFKGGTAIATKEYPGFKSGGIMFTKSEEVIQPIENGDEYVNASDEKLLNDIEEFHGTLDEKLKFLCEGHNPALPVQVMIIQMETLYTAMKQKCLKPMYLQKWLNNTYKDLAKLEEEAAPTGWLLQWDRAHKRYYYHNQTTGENQWEYPQPDILSVDEAMDISTTPPPPMISEEQQPVDSMNMILPPPPPKIKERSMSPPPPPIISDYQMKGKS
ncbi:hypothetical protein AMK59_3201 [Oryctes borbonicus]|uniref:WW domain-containing protein n=1 Tax=Oryctes borbonicus TaxID=1629725 RepID=A0A0T6B698_9SCAR|nr:hypothetical protein AMK59_3201 [Oryctes borbonicus]